MSGKSWVCHQSNVFSEIIRGEKNDITTGILFTFHVEIPLANLEICQQCDRFFYQVTNTVVYLNVLHALDSSPLLFLIPLHVLR